MLYMRFCIKISKTIIEALKALNEYNTLQTLFVIDDENKLKGSLTDGDIRRYLIAGGQLYDTVDKAMFLDFSVLNVKSPTLLSEMRNLRNRRIKAVPCVDGQGRIVDVYDLENYKSHLPIDAVLMAGGKGERLRPLTETTPKPLLKVGTKCIIDYNVDHLISYGVRHLSVTVNYLKEQLEEHFAKPRGNVQVKMVREPKFLGTIGSIRFVENFYNDTVLLMNSDLFTNIDYEDFFLHFKEYDADMSIVAVPYTISVPYGIFELDGHIIKGVLEKPTYNYYANAGIYLIKRELLNLIPKGKFLNATDFIDMLMKENCKIIRYPLNSTWIDIGNPQEYQKAKELIKHL